MSGRYLILSTFLAYIIICGGNITPVSFPLCNQPLYRTAPAVNWGEQASFSIRFGVTNLIYHWKAKFTWDAEGSELCSLSREGSCGSVDSISFTPVTGSRDQTPREKYVGYIDFELTIFKSSYSDQGIYTLHSSVKNRCTVLKVTINVMVAIPLCNATLLDDMFIKLFCKWVPRTYGDQMQLFAGNKTLQSYGYERPTSNSGTISAWNTATVISATIAAQDIFANDRLPDACIVSNPEISFQDQCSFSVYMSPKLNKLSDYRSDISFTCCTETDDVPSLWWYSEDTEHRRVNIVGQSFMLDINDYNINSESKISVLLICGKEIENRRLLYGIGELRVALNLPYRDSVIVSVKIKADRIGSRVLSNGQNCPHRYNISVLANTSRNEHSTKRITFDTEVPTISTFTTFPPERNTSSNCTDPKKSDLLLPTNESHFGVFWHNETWISMIVILSISLLLNIVFCINKCYNIMTIKKRPPAEGSNPQINLRSVHRREEDTMRGVPISSDPPRPADPDSFNGPRTSIDEGHQPSVPLSGRKKEKSKPLKGQQHDPMAPHGALCSKSLAAGCHIISENNATDEQSYEALEVNAPERHVYQNLGNNDHKEGIYSVADDRQYSKGNETNFQPTNIATDHACRFYSNSDVPLQVRDEHTMNTPESSEYLYAIPDKPPGLGTVTVGDASFTVSALSVTSHPVGPRPPTPIMIV